MRNLVIVFALLMAAAVAVFVVEITGAQAVTHVGVTLTDFKVSMTSTSVPAGVPITFAATNKGQTMHEVVLEKAGAVDQPLAMNGGEAELEDIAPGETKSATWTITQPGVYQLACHVPGHFEAGMVQQFTVTAATGSDDSQIGAPMQGAAPSAEDLAEHADPLAGGSSAAMPVVAALTLPATGGTLALSPLGWFAAAIVLPLLAAYAAFRLIVRHIRSR